MSTVWEYARQGKWGSVNELLHANSALATASDTENLTLMHYVAEANENALTTAELLLSYGADVNASDSLGNTPLHHAAYIRSPHMITFLLSNGADCVKTNNDCIEATYYLDDEPECTLNTIFNACTPWGSSARYPREELIWQLDDTATKAAEHGNDHYLAGLLKFYPELLETHANKMLCAAIRAGEHDIIALLLDTGADINAANERGWRPLHQAASEDNMTIAEMLLQRGADPNATYESGNLNHEYSYMNHIYTKDTLGAQLEDSLHEDIDWVKLLLQYGYTRYDAALEYIVLSLDDCTEATELIKRLYHLALEQGIPVDINYLLCFAAEIGNDEPMNIFLSLGADVNYESKAGHALHLCIVYSSNQNDGGVHLLSLLPKFIDAGVNLNAVSDVDIFTHGKRKGTPLDIVFEELDSSNGQIPVSAYLIARGAKLSPMRPDGCTLLHLLCQKASENRDEADILHGLVRDVLATSSVDANALNTDGKTALHYASEANDPVLIAMLEQYRTTDPEGDTN